ncbi:TIGR03016 family PEP-CTERM system-associated outer membrane protein [Thalassotalea sp. M1531]|uniref:TIGR03016 family PEP-CTERM system-associated outer membrane protein n=1 Tax=Thalassotalea algicola TaxID=2716224 RepID=A0A7Y0LF68_9GAMM|nr:TIGR03016 family PEP-CTERM system-associated outer membrane protein [Thalassotalea algicola]NMP33074.1 TIGR03016 family PEP-CTERM system-associated outer membrane protein [Thalassotalea algicola]
MAVRNKFLLPILINLFIQPLSMAADNNISPFISVEEIFTDNVNLDSFDEEDSFVSKANVGLQGEIDSAMVDAKINAYYSHLFFSHDSDENDGHETLNTNINITPWEKGPSLSLTGAIANVPRSNGENFAADLISGDTVRTTNYGAGLNYQIINSDFLFNSSISYNDSRSDDEVGESNGYTTSLGFQNGTSHRTIFWDLNGSYSDRKNRGQSARSYRIEAKLGLITNWKLNPFIRYYDESYTGSISNNSLEQGESLGAGFRWQPLSLMEIDISYNNAEDPELSDDYVAFDFSWQPTTRTQIAANYNQRFFGDSYGLNISHRNKRLTNTISYNEQIQAFQRDRFETFVESTVFCPFNQQITIDDCLDTLDGVDNPELFFEAPLLGIRAIEDNQFSLYKTLSWDSELAFTRTTFNFRVSGNEREELNSGDTQEFVTVSLDASRKLSPRSDLNLGFRFTRNDYYTTNNDTNADRQDYYRSYNIGYSRQLARLLSLDIDVRHLMRTSNFTSREYDETRATISIKKDF